MNSFSGKKKSEKRSAAFTLRVQKVKTKFTLKKLKLAADVQFP